MKYEGNFRKEISFPLGGIGTGSVGLGGDGRLIDWEIFNKPSKGKVNGYTHFAIRAIQGDKCTAAVLNGDAMSDFSGQYRMTPYHMGFGYGCDVRKMCGFPHFKDLKFYGEFPVATIEFKDEAFPANVEMKAFNPFIPRDAKNSSIPAAFFEFEVENTTDEKAKYQIAFSVANPYKKCINRAEKKGNINTITFLNNGADKEEVSYGELTIATDSTVSFTQTYWYRGQWMDSVVSFWNEFSTVNDIKERLYESAGDYDVRDDSGDTGTLIAEVEVLPKQKGKIKFVMSWNIPNTYNYWSGEENPEIKKPWKNYYATVFDSSLDSALYSLKNWEDLYKRTIKFKDVLHNQTLPSEVIDAASSSLSVLKSPTVLRLEDGSFYGWEGVSEQAGSCQGTCQHVWNYAYALCFLFPELERSIREMEFKYNTDENGMMGYRIMLPLGAPMTAKRACVDGQMGAVIKCYREWKISGDNPWLKANWENIKKVLEYAWSKDNIDAWDLDKDAVLEGRQHHTLDMELFGPSSWLEGMYLAALKAASEMGEFLGDTLKATEYREMFEKGKKWMKENLFNGKYFIQKVDITDKNITDKYNAPEYWNDEVKQIKYQICEGSSIDQVLAQWHADLIGLGEIYDKEQLDSALREMVKYNYKNTMRGFTNPWRIFSVNDEAGSVICEYPETVEKPKIPIPYCEETMTGFEYSFAGLLFSRGRIEDGIKAVKAVRDRFNGEKRNPWNEFECGSNYARSMASYALIPILSGFEFDMPNNHIGFNPYKTGEFSCVWSLEDAWGNFEISNNTAKINIYDGNISLKSLGLKFCEKISSVKIDGKDIDFEFRNGKIYFEKTNISENMVITI